MISGLADVILPYRYHLAYGLILMPGEEIAFKALLLLGYRSIMVSALMACVVRHEESPTELLPQLLREHPVRQQAP
jgi:hypothetical protein